MQTVCVGAGGHRGGERVRKKGSWEQRIVAEVGIVRSERPPARPGASLRRGQTPGERGPSGFPGNEPDNKIVVGAIRFEGLKNVFLPIFKMVPFGEAIDPARARPAPLSSGAVKTPVPVPIPTPPPPPRTLPGGLWALRVAKATARKRLSPKAWSADGAMARGLRETSHPGLLSGGVARGMDPAKQLGCQGRSWWSSGKGLERLQEEFQRFRTGGVGGGGTSSLDNPSLSLFWGLQWAAGPPGSFQ